MKNKLVENYFQKIQNLYKQLNSISIWAKNLRKQLMWLWEIHDSLSLLHFGYYVDPVAI